MAFYSQVENACMTESFHLDGKFWPIKLVQLTLTLFIEMPGNVRKVGGQYICMLGVSILHLFYDFFLFNFRTVPTVGYIVL